MRVLRILERKSHHRMGVLLAPALTQSLGPLDHLRRQIYPGFTARLGKPNVTGFFRRFYHPNRKSGTSNSIQKWVLFFVVWDDALFKMLRYAILSAAQKPSVFNTILNDFERANVLKTARLPAILTVIVFVNAVLLFSVEPMFSKLVLPLLGGTPSVWNTCLVFFQAALLAGYGYAHMLTRIGDPKRRTAVHVAALALSCFALPLSIAGSSDPPSGSAGIPWLLLLLVRSLGAPFVMLSSGAVLAQQWLVASRHPDSANPYFLYAASNFGSLIALLAYPIVVEPHLTLSAQRWAWSAGYVALAALVTVSFAVVAWMNPSITAGNGEPEGATRITVTQRARWALYAAVPSSLLVGVTTFISTDVAAVPLLWVLPLSVYLLSFVIVFSRRPALRHSWMVRAAPHALVIVAIPVFWNVRLPGLFGVIVHLVVLFIVAMVCHGELARMRPPATQLTDFFVWIAVGGLIGGAFNALVAPILFDRVYEYPIILAIAAMLLPSRDSGTRLRGSDLIVASALAACLLLVTIHIGPLPNLLAVIVTLVFGVLLFSFRGRPVRFGLALGSVFAAGYFAEAFRVGGTTTLDSERSYFGVYRVARDAASRTTTMYHGTTLHGAQSLDPSRRLTPLTYYHPRGPAGDLFLKSFAGTKAQRNVAVVGLGAGSLACYGRPAERWTYYEIDAVVANIALDSTFFTFLHDCPPSIHIVLGDARLTLSRSHDAPYDVLVLDAFSSDAIPVHLLTREAFDNYFAHLAPDGVIAVHISNNYLDLEPVVASLANELGAFARIRRDLQIPEADAKEGRTPSIWMILARSPSDFGELKKDPKWEPLRRRADVGVWTDDYSNIIRVFKWQ